MAKLIDFLNWIKTSFEDDNGHASHRKLTVFSFSLLVWMMIYLTYKSGNPNMFPEIVWIAITGGALGMSGLRALTYRNKNEDTK